MSTMTDEQRKRVHEITYSTEDREELAERIVALEDERDKLQDENARLRSCLSDDAENARQIMGESEKLREQVMRLQAELGIPPHDYKDRKRMLEADDRDWCPMQLSGVARCEGPDPALKAENDKLRKLLSNALIAAGFDGRQYLDAYLREEEETNLLQELKSVGMDVGV